MHDMLRNNLKKKLFNCLILFFIGVLSFELSLSSSPSVGHGLHVVAETRFSFLKSSEFDWEDRKKEKKAPLAIARRKDRDREGEGEREERSSGLVGSMT